eukprot:s2016_g3.t1
MTNSTITSGIETPPSPQPPHESVQKTLQLCKSWYSEISKRPLRTPAKNPVVQYPMRQQTSNTREQAMIAAVA